MPNRYILYPYINTELIQAVIPTSGNISIVYPKMVLSYYIILILWPPFLSTPSLSVFSASVARIGTCCTVLYLAQDPNLRVTNDSWCVLLSYCTQPINKSRWLLQMCFKFPNLHSLKRLPLTITFNHPHKEFSTTSLYFIIFRIYNNIWNSC